MHPSRNRRLPLTLLLIAASGASGCAYSYKSIQFDDVDYHQAQTDGPYEIDYRYKVLDGSSNTRWGKKELKKGVYVVGVRIQNHSDQALPLDEGTLRVRAGQEPLRIVDGASAATEMKQAVWPRALWSLLWVTFWQTDGENTTAIPIPVGVPVAIMEVSKSRSANRAVKEDFLEKELVSQTIPAGGSAEGLLFLRNASYRPLTFEVAPRLAGQ